VENRIALGEYARGLTDITIEEQGEDWEESTKKKPKTGYNGV